MATATARDEAVIRADGLGKVYRIYPRPQDRLLQYLSRRPRYAEHRALDGVSFTIGAGEVVGILGRNGSGKSTLLQILCDVIRPSEGAWSVRGRAAALLELGAGFNPEFTGVENVYINAGILGLSRRETQARLPEILAFADIGEFAHRPVKLYSSGMYVRLAFAVATCIEPDVLIIDEALAVGDIRFQAKCFRRFRELVKSGRTVIFVTHSLELVVRHCSRALLLEGGRLIADGAPREVTNLYRELMLGAGAPAALPSEAPSGDGEDDRATPPANGSRLEDRPGYLSAEYRWGNGGATLEDACIITPDGRTQTRFDAGAAVEIRMRASFSADHDGVIFGFFVKTPDGVVVYGSNSETAPGCQAPVAVRRGEVLRVSFAVSLDLGTGSYILSAGVSARQDANVVPLDRRYDCLHFEVYNDSGAVGLADLRAACRPVERCT